MPAPLDESDLRTPAYQLLRAVERMGGAVALPLDLANPAHAALLMAYHALRCQEEQWKP